MAVRHARPADASAMARVFVDSFRTGHRGQLPEADLLSRTLEASERGWARDRAAIAADADPVTFLLVAEDAAGRVAGLAMAGPPKPWPADEAARRARDR